ncbi:uncharacterized protein BJ212DRAFT_238250 [Suillus subaureus]|uniref:C2H2-type domain-containing protein n=1 Tax=Suillus subaureus TaxID=48587 RepID=A0A9P7EA27_9AGAM|nr:uncharacterized protein BJ212DRAFT_238250 [Suillus subaureus]KAG1815714.1 hypothetical protein BJ212DRAFT_238250 [Suillus subaureus]
MNNGGQSNSSSDYRAMAPFVNPQDSYASRKAKIEEAKRKLVEMELQNDLEEAVRQGREAEQRLAAMKAKAAEIPIVTGLSSASGSVHYPNAVYQSAEEAPLTARIEGEVRDSPPNSSRPPIQMTHNHQRNYPTTNQSQQTGFQGDIPQISTQPLLQRPSFAQTQSQAAARSQSSHAPYPLAPSFAVHGYQHSHQASSTPYQTTYQGDQPHQQPRSRHSEEYWAKQSQKYAAELAGAGISHYATQVQHRVASPAAPSVATIVSSTQHPSLSSAEPQTTNRQSSGNLAQSVITKPEFIRRFQLACNGKAQILRNFLSSNPVAVEWWSEAARSVNPKNLKDEGVVKMLNDMKNLTWSSFHRGNSSASASTDVHVPTAISATSVATVQPLPPPTNPPSAQQMLASLGSKEDFVRYFHERFQRADVNVIVDFLMRKLHSVPEEWRRALLGTLTPELLKEFGHALTRAKASTASKHLPATSTTMPDASSNGVPTVAQQSRTTAASNVVTPATMHTTSESSKSIPVPPRPSVTKSTQVKSTNAHPPRASTSNRTVATTVAALATKTTPAPQAQASVSTTQTAPSAPSMQPAISLTGTSIYGQVEGSAYRPFSVPPPMSIPSADGNVAQYAYDPYSKKYVRVDIPNEHTVSSGSNAGTHHHAPVSKTYDGQQPPALVPQGIPVSTQAPPTVLIPPATPLRREQNGAAPVARTPQQADRSRLAKDILRSLGINPPPATAEEEEEADEEADVSPGNLPATVEHQQETPPSRNLSAEPLHEAPQEISLLQPPSNGLMEQEQQPQTQTRQSPIKEAVANDIIMGDEPGTTTPEKDTASPEFSIPATTLCPASASMDQEELARGVDGMSIATNVHRSEPSREDGPIDSPISFPDLDEPLPPALEPVGISSSAPSFREQSREKSGDNGSGALPLFLPSLSASPAPSDHSSVPLPPETDDEVLMTESILRGGSPSKSRVDLLDVDHARTSLRSVKRKKGQRVYVLVPPPPPELRRAIKKRKLEDQGIVSGSEEEESKYNDFEQALIADCRVRMVERPCQWNGCDALINCGENLYLHLKLHLQETSSQASGFLTARSGDSPIISRGPLYATGRHVLGGSSRQQLWKNTYRNIHTSLCHVLLQIVQMFSINQLRRWDMKCATSNRNQSRSWR